MKYGKNKNSSSVAGDPGGPGGVSAAGKKNPNSHEALNDSPDGPFSHEMGYTGDGGCHGDVKVSGKDGSFYFK